MLRFTLVNSLYLKNFLFLFNNICRNFFSSNILGVHSCYLHSNVFYKCTEIFIFSSKVCLNIYFNKNAYAPAAVNIGLYNTFRSNSSGLISSFSNTLFTKILYSLFYITISLHKSLFTIHHSGSGAITEIFYHTSTNTHLIILLYVNTILLPLLNQQAFHQYQHSL